MFSREDGTTCRLKWVANPEKGITGYRVYRMDGRWNKDSVSRLSADPIVETKYADASAAESSRHYYVVAVDALGQEDFPSGLHALIRHARSYCEGDQMLYQAIKVCLDTLHPQED